MKKYFNFLCLFLLLSTICYFGCRESVINQADNCIKLPLIFSIPYGSDVDGGFFYFFTGKHISQSNIEVDNSVNSQVILFYRYWKDSINVFLDSFKIYNTYQKVQINPFLSHTWYVQENQQYGIPQINKVIPQIIPLEIYSPSLFQSVSNSFSLNWNLPNNNSNTETFIFISKVNFNNGDSTNSIIIPTDDDGSFTITQDYLNSFTYGDTIKITISRLWTDVDTINNKKYFFATSFSNNTYIVLHY